jgi:hypothetical protein
MPPSSASAAPAAGCGEDWGSKIAGRVSTAAVAGGFTEIGVASMGALRVGEGCAHHTRVREGGGWLTVVDRDAGYFFSILIFFNHYLRNEHVKSFFKIWFF